MKSLHLFDPFDCSILKILMLSGILVLGGVGTANALAANKVQQAVIEAVEQEAAPNKVSRQLLFIDSAVPEPQVLLQSIADGVEVFFINEGQAGLQQIAEVVKDRSGIETIHILSHGKPGQLILGGSPVDREVLKRNAVTLSTIGNALGRYGDIRLYGCHVAAGPEGQAFINEMADKTGAGVVASSDLTGASSLGGNWVLEVATEAIVTNSAWNSVPDDYRYTLAASQNFDSEALANSGSTVATYGDFTFSADGSANISIVDTYLATAMGTDNALRFDGDFKHDLTTNSFYTTDGSEFKLDSFVISVQGDEQLTITGKQNGSVVQTANLDFALANTSNGGATFTGFDGNAYVGTLTFSGWDYIDEVVITLNQPPSFYLDNDMDDLVVSTAVTPNLAPTISVDNTTLGYTEDDAVTQIDSAATLSDSNGDGDWNGGTLEVQITANNEAADEISIPDNIVGTINTSGLNLLNGTTTIGTLSASEGTVTSGTKLIITFNANATNTLVQQVIQAVHYRNTSDDPGTLNRTVTFTATDKNSAGASDTRVISVAATNDSPVITSDGGGATASISVNENTTAVTTVTATDSDSADTLTYSISGGADSAKFSINSSTGVLTFASAPNYESPSDTGSNNVYDVQVTVTDSGTGNLTDVQDIAVTVNNVNEAPVITGQGTLTMPADTSITITLGDLTVIDLDSSYPTGFSLTLYSGPNYSLSGNIVIPAPGYIGNLTVPATVNDGALASNVFNLLVTVTDSPDIDGDGMPNDWETANGLDPLDPTDASLDLDGDGLTNLQEYQANTDPAVDDNPPVVTAPSDVTVDSTGLFTAVDTGSATAVDALDGAVSATSDAPSYFSPGVHTVTWSATDAAGNTGTATQTINVLPQVSFDKDQATVEGSTLTIRAILNGSAVTYPVTIPYTVGGTAATDGTDHNLVDGDIIISSGTEASLSFTTVNDGTGEGNETIVISMGTPTNAVPGAHAVDTIEIVEDNLPPEVSLSADQSTGTTHTIVTGNGLVTVNSTVTDPNTGDIHSYDWAGTDNALIDTDGASNTFTFDPSTLSPGFYILHLSVSDGTASSDAALLLEVLSVAPSLSSIDDSDGDGLTDALEGYGDVDGDGIADYLDANDSSNVLQEIRAQIDSFLIETEPGLRLTLGSVAFRSGQNQAMVSMTDVESYGGVIADSGNQYAGGLFDFNVDGIPLAGQSVQVVLPQQAAIPANAVYRKVVGGLWQNFVEDTSNSVASAAGAQGYCPPPGDSAYTAGLTEGDWCVQLTIEDGGPNDADAVANNSVADPGGVTGVASVATTQNTETLRVSSGGGSGSPWLLALLGVLLWRAKLVQRETKG